MEIHYKLNRLMLSVALWGLTLTAVLAQGVRGRVTDATSKGAIPGATIIAVGTNLGSTADANGDYSIKLNPGNYTLRVSFVGYESVSVPVTVAAGTDVTANAELKESAASLGEVVVIGSRAQTARTNVQTAAPVDVISTKELKGFSQVDISQVLNYVAPSFNSNRQTVTDGTDHIDPASLRGLGPDQVLVLVNGKRRHTTALVNINGSVGRGAVGTDMNVIPVAAVERIEVLRDGAAAQYGTDAIAGVINVVLKKNYTGFSASLTGGQNMTTIKYMIPNSNGGQDQKTQKINDGSLIQFDFTKGFRLGKEGRLSVSGQYNNHDRTNRSADDNSPTIYMGTAGGFPTTPTGEDETTYRRNLITQDQAMIQQRGYDRHNMILGNSNAQNLGLFINGGIPTNAKSEFYFSGGVTYRTGTGYGNFRTPNSRNQQPVRTDGSLYYPDGFLPGIQSKINDVSAILGYKTMLGQWNLDVSNVIGQNIFKFSVANSGNASLPASDNQQTLFDAGRLSFLQNTFNLDFSRRFVNASNASLNVAYGGEVRFENFMIKAGEPNSYSGDPNRRLALAPPQSGTVVAAPGAQVFPGYQPSDEINKSRVSEAVYVDLEGEKGILLVGAAGRFENYSDFGSTINGKLTARVQVTPAIALRGSVSTGFRAPSLHQRYFQNTSTQFVNGLPSNTLTLNNDSPIVRNVIGVNALKPETSVNLAAGITARAGRGFTLTIDAYQIDITDRIVYSGSFTRAQLGFGTNDYPGVNLVRFFANAINTRTQGLDIVASERFKAGTGQLTLTAAVNFNKNTVKAINSTPLIDDPKNNPADANPSNWYRTSLFDRNQISIIEDYLPRSKWNLSAMYTIGKFDISLRTVRFGEVKFKTPTDPDAKKADGTYWNTQFNRDETGHAFIDQTFKAVWITDLSVTYRATKATGVTLGANNIFDIYPDQIYIDPRNALGSTNYSSARDNSNRGRFLYQPNQGGFNGRYVFGRVSVNF
ncbi:TonB-dependent receptor [Spirosoma sp. BT702]|uniref:TonB-dependent receptor n=1 Tax=Spirosoma profusum TaxID=2771354 RepID=A0A926XV65_9BACT|nr:TonB-dependent receptor [Spirosoma profusum]MBD2700794.1 TonB-dependent receptor [Spirosoma profusum]